MRKLKLILVSLCLSFSTPILASEIDEKLSTILPSEIVDQTKVLKIEQGVSNIDKLNVFIDNIDIERSLEIKEIDNEKFIVVDEFNKILEKVFKLIPSSDLPTKSIMVSKEMLLSDSKNLILDKDKLYINVKKINNLMEAIIEIKIEDDAVHLISKESLFKSSLLKTINNHYKSYTNKELKIDVNAISSLSEEEFNTSLEYDLDGLNSSNIISLQGLYKLSTFGSFTHTTPYSVIIDKEETFIKDIKTGDMIKSQFNSVLNNLWFKDFLENAEVEIVKVKHIPEDNKRQVDLEFKNNSFKTIAEAYLVDFKNIDKIDFNKSKNKVSFTYSYNNHELVQSVDLDMVSISNSKIKLNVTTTFTSK